MDSDNEIILGDKPEVEADYAQSLINGVLKGLSEANDSDYEPVKPEPTKPDKIPDFTIQDIVGDFDIDDAGNFIMVRGEQGGLMDRKHRQVNQRGYLIDSWGNVINTNGEIIFMAS